MTNLPANTYYKDGALINKSPNRLSKRVDYLEQRIEILEKMINDFNKSSNNKTGINTK